MNKKSIGLLLAGLVLLPGCISVPKYQRRSLHSFNDSSLSQHTEKGVTIRTKRLNSSEKDYLLNGRTIIPLNDVEILYIAVHNLSHNDYTIAPSEIGLTQMSHRDIMKKIKKTNSIARLSGATITSVPAIAAITVLSSGPFALIFGSIGLLSPLLALSLTGIAAISAIPFCAFLGSGIKSVVMNARISTDVKEKTLHKQMLIKSGDKYEGLIFVKSSDYVPTFSITLHEKDNIEKNVMFDVDLR